ncbi:MAG: hypothetical protein HY329_02590 [Chloroflexi bacterium]|nr:hypothetical protein [Chloroflexota bacterium]
MRTRGSEPPDVTLNRWQIRQRAQSRCLWVPHNVCRARSPPHGCRLMCANPTVASRVIVTLSLQVLRLEEQLERMALLPVPTRLAQMLIQLAEDNGVNSRHD